jgi:(p)ppGpp synthase/HD superfamily hydrolase
VLGSGDQIEIITSKNQTPSPDWEKFCVTHKAKSHIRRWVREDQRKAIDEGRELWEKKVKKAKLSINEDDLNKFLGEKRMENVGMFYLAIRQEKINPDEVIKMIQDEQKHPAAVVTEEGKIEGLFNRFVSSARGIAGGIVLEGKQENYMHNYAKCCNPIPGDEVVGFVTTGEGIKLHRRGCRNIKLMIGMDARRVVEVSWPSENGVMFVAGVKISGDDRPGMLSDITHAISTYMSTNLRSVTIDSEDSFFQGTFIMYVRDTEHLSRILERIKKIKGVSRAERFEE